MGTVLSYSGLSTKIRAMQSRLVTDEQLEEIVQLPNVPQVTAYLKRTPEYQNIWSGLDENDLHRGQIEKLLKKSIFLNFSRLYCLRHGRFGLGQGQPAAGFASPFAGGPGGLRPAVHHAAPLC